MTISATQHEALLVACWLIDDPPPAVACIPARWLTDPDARRIWGLLADGASPHEAVRASIGRGDGSGVLMWCLRSISSACLWNIRWHAHLVYLEHQRRTVRAAWAGWVQDADRGISHEVPPLWPFWEAAAIDAAPAERAAAALEDEQRRGESWTEDRQLLWVLSARIDARRPPSNVGA